jgi:membrane protease YdiL (CAAX protease family)
LIVFFLGFVLAGIVMIPIFLVFGQGDAVTVGASVVGEAVPGALLVLWLRSYHPGWQGAIGFPPRQALPREILYGVVAGLMLYAVVAFVVGGILTALFEQASGEPAETPEQLPTVHGLAIVSAVALALVAAPIVEELFFRGCLFRSLRDRRGFAPAALSSASLFGLVHYIPGPWQDTLLLITIMVATGVGLAWIYERRGNIVAAMAAHATFNVIGLILILSGR